MTLTRPAGAPNSAWPWWRDAVFYQVYPRSFADGNGDGIGDLTGLIDRLDYLRDLGVDAIWLSPHYPSPQKDVGYDISDYTGVNPEYGTLDDFRRLLDGLKQRGMRIVTDLVLNHSSDQHPWFQESRSSRDNPKRDWYIWRDGRDGGPPNNWVSQFGGSAWQLDPRTGQYYYHCFLPEQPDLNWRNPELREQMWSVTRFWLDLGVDGFRLDAIGTLFEAPDLPDAPATYSPAALHLAMIRAKTNEERAAVTKQFGELFHYTVDQPGIHDLMKDFRRVVDEYRDRVLIGETDQVAFYGDGSDELDLVFNFPLMSLERITAVGVRRNQDERWMLLPPGTWPANTVGNHDQGRVRSRFAFDGNDLIGARLAGALVLLLPGTPFLYAGDELGMTDLEITDQALIRDSWASWFHDATIEEGLLDRAEADALTAQFTRDRARSPIQWANAPNGGFSPKGVETWLPVNANFAEGINAADEEADPDSLLHFYRRLLAVRRSQPALRHGPSLMLDPLATDYLAFVRRGQSWSALSQDGSAASDCLVVLNVSDRPQKLAFELPGRLRTLLSDRERADATEPGALEIGPHETYVAEVVA